jgi:hypothetical protein
LKECNSEQEILKSVDGEKKRSSGKGHRVLIRIGGFEILFSIRLPVSFLRAPLTTESSVLLAYKTSERRETAPDTTSRNNITPRKKGNTHARPVVFSNLTASESWFPPGQIPFEEDGDGVSAWRRDAGVAVSRSSSGGVKL